MKEYIKHLLRESRVEITQKSLRHCHSPNLHSIMLVDKPEQRLRLFVTDVTHILWQNYRKPVVKLSTPLSIAFHPHHCNVTLHVLSGEITNWTVFPDFHQGELHFNRYLYDSKITGGGSGFKRCGDLPLAHNDEVTYRAGESVYMKANEIHTVGVPRGKHAAWLVYEGREDPNYMPVCWSNVPLELLSLDGLYQPMSAYDLKNVLVMAGIKDA